MLEYNLHNFPLNTWVELDEGDAMSLTGAGGPMPLTTPWGTFWGGNDEAGPYGLEVSDLGFVCLAIGGPEGIYCMMIPPPAEPTIH